MSIDIRVTLAFMHSLTLCGFLNGSDTQVRLVPLLGAKSPVAAVANSGKQVVSLDSSATVTCVAAPRTPPPFSTATRIGTFPATSPAAATGTPPATTDRSHLVTK